LIAQAAIIDVDHLDCLYLSSKPISLYIHFQINNFHGLPNSTNLKALLMDNVGNLISENL